METFDLPGPSLEEHFGELQRSIGRHPAYKDRFGRDPDDLDDSDNALSDGALEETNKREQQEWEKQSQEMKRKLEAERAVDEMKKKEARIEKGSKRKGINTGKEKGEKEKRETKKRRVDPRPPPPVPPKQPLERALSVGREENVNQIEVERPPPAVAGPSGYNSHAKKQPSSVIDDPPPRHPPRGSSPSLPPRSTSEANNEMLEISSDSDREAPSAKQHRPSKSTVPKRLEPSDLTASKGGGSKGKNKARVSMEQAIEQAQKIRLEELKTRFTDISSFIDHLSAFQLDRPGKLLQGCRIAFVNPDHWKANNGTTGTTRNRFDQGLRLELGIVAKQGGTLVKPEEFVPAPAEANTKEMNEQEIERRAEEGGWTTHVIGFHPSNARPPTFNQVLDCLGEGGLTVDELGPFVKVVTFPWVSQCVKERKKQSEWEFALKGDPRDAPSSRVSSTKSSPTKKAANSAKDRRQGKKKKGPDEEGDTTEESHGEEDEEVAKGGISPFGTQDYPAGERPPSSDRKGKGKQTSTGIHSDVSEPDLAPTESFNPLEGLEAQSKIVKDLGDDVVDHELYEQEREADWMIYKGAKDDNETEDEEEEEEARRSGKTIKKPDPSEKRTDRRGYVVNQEFVEPGHQRGPNDATADVLLQLSELHKGDQWRERGYRQAAGALRRMKYKVTDYKDLVKIRGIGEKIAEKIVEINKTGTHRKLSNELPEDKAARLFSGIYGIGLALGHSLAKQGATTIDDLRKEEYFSTLTVDQQIGLKYYDDLLERIPRDEVTELYKIVLEAARQVDSKIVCECMGSYRRGSANSGDIDILVTRDPTEDGKTHSGAIGKMYKILKSQRFFQHILSQSDDWSDLTCKVNGLCKLKGGKMRRIDILGVPWEDMPAALIYFTGNDHFNRSLRLKARHMGYSLNQKCLSRFILRGKDGLKLTEGQRINVKSEKEIFDILEVPWKRPEERIPS